MIDNLDNLWLEIVDIIYVVINLVFGITAIVIFIPILISVLFLGILYFLYSLVGEPDKQLGRE